MRAGTGPKGSNESHMIAWPVLVSSIPRFLQEIRCGFNLIDEQTTESIGNSHCYMLIDFLKVQ